MSRSQGDDCQVHKSASVLSRDALPLIQCLTNEINAGFQAALLAHARISLQLRPGLRMPAKKLPRFPERLKIAGVKLHWVGCEELPSV